MDMKRYERITGREALGKLLEGQRVFFKALGEIHHYEISHNELLVTTSPSGYSYATLQSFLKEADTNWYVKKPFGVRAEMLARPNEWVGAFRDPSGWHKVGFDTDFMLAVATDINSNMTTDLCAEVERACKQELDRCIPIEDVPKEELT